MESDHRSAKDIADAQTMDGSGSSTIDGVVRMARETFGSDEKAQRWLRRPTQALSGESPIDASSASASGAEKVIDLLRRIDHGLSV